MSLQGQISKVFQKKLGIYAGLPRFQRVSDGAYIYGYLSATKIVANVWMAENVMVGNATCDVVLHDGDLILDRITSRYFYVVSLDNIAIAGVKVLAQFQAYMCNDTAIWQRLTKGNKDAFTHQPVTSVYTTIQPSVKILMSVANIFSTGGRYISEDTSQFVLYHNYLTVQQGDRITIGSGNQYIIQTNEYCTMNGHLVRSICVGGTGG